MSTNNSNHNIPIDLERIKVWLQRCRNTHGDCCNTRYTTALSQRLETLNLVDVDTYSLVTLPCSTPFVALSYVWGDVPICKATKANLEALRQNGALLESQPNFVIPDTIRDAMYLVKKLGQRYLWVDCLCLLQDADQKEMQEMLEAMANIYASAEFTIVDAGGKNANRGLRGIGNRAKPRTKEDLPDDEDRGYPFRSKWASRGWTFQESLFARRLVVFEGYVSWICGQTVWLEEDEEEEEKGLEEIRHVPEERPHLGVPMGMMSLLPQLPSLGRWGMLVENFSGRSVTYEEDTERAFVGATDIMGSTFPGGIFRGLPEFFFDIALLWQPKTILQRRTDAAPSWSWTGWKGQVECLDSWFPFFAGIYRESGDASDWLAVAPLRPTARFYKRSLPTGDFLAISNDFYRYQALRTDPSSVEVEGWQRHDHPEGDYFAYDHEKRAFRYAFPLPTANQSSNSQAFTTFSHILKVQAPSLRLRIGQTLPYGLHELSYLLNPEGEVIGYVLHTFSDDSPITTVDLLAVSEAEVTNLDRMDEEMGEDYPEEWDLHLWETGTCSTEEGFEGKGGPFGFYNVLWITWKGDIAYRQGLGKVGKRSWDTLGPEVIDVALG